MTQKEAWRVAYPLNGSGGVLATAGNLVFQGTIGTSMAAYRADNGKKLWEMPVQNVPVAAPIAYTVDGEQYVAVNAGWGGGLAHVERAKYTSLFLGKPRLLVFKLGGTARLPPLPPASMIVPELQPPPRLTAGADVVAKGEKLYGANCVLCHGIAARGGVKDLRHMSPATHGEFLDIVIGGKRGGERHGQLCRHALERRCRRNPPISDRARQCRLGRQRREQMKRGTAPCLRPNP